MITVVFTCNRRPALTELCLRRLVELMPHPYELFICYDGDNPRYERMLREVAPEAIVMVNLQGVNRFALINTALENSIGDLFMHVESDFYWVDPSCLDAALNAFHKYHDLDYIRYEQLPFTWKSFYQYKQVDGKDICWMRDESPYRFTFNPSIRTFKYPTDNPFPSDPYEWESRNMHDEAYMNDGYKYQSACMTGDNWRHLGIYSEGGHYKEFYGERFFNKRGKVASHEDEYLTEFMRITRNQEYVDLFKRYLNDNRNKRGT